MFLRRCVSKATLVLAMVLVPAPGGASAPPGHDGQRVIIQVNRNLEVKGYVHEEDGDRIVVRTPDGMLESFPKSRVLKIVRLVDPLTDQTGVVVLRNGQRRRGIVIEDTFDHVLLEIEGLRTKLRRSTVDYVVLEPTFEQRYAQYKKALRPNVPSEHLDLCLWLIELRKYELARIELIELTRKTQTPEALRVLKVVNAQLALKVPPRPGDDYVEEPQGGPNRPATPDETGALPDPILTYDDVNLIRVYEIDFDRPPKISIDAETIRTLIDGYGGEPLIPTSRSKRTAFFRADPLKVASIMFELRARELYPRIKVITEPWALNLFRRRVHNAWLINSCSTSRCHGGPGAGRFSLHLRHYKDPRVRYTNLLILQRLELDPEWPLINYEDPELSLIIQYGLPRDEARKPHPDVRGWKPVFGHGGKRMLQDTTDWIRSMMAPRPDYPVVFDPAASPQEEPPPPPPPEQPAEGSPD